MIGSLKFSLASAKFGICICDYLVNRTISEHKNTKKKK